jgi:hypothetical protein
MNTFINEKIFWATAGGTLLLLVAFLLGGVHTITPPSAGYRLQDEPLHR